LTSDRAPLGGGGLRGHTKITKDAKDTKARFARKNLQTLALRFVGAPMARPFVCFAPFLIFV
jgi:hypothetical protein